jgi:hypothetical protein
MESLVNSSETVVRPFVEARAFAVHNVLGKLEHLGDVVLKIGILLLEPVVHLVQQRDGLSNGEVNPIKLNLLLSSLVLQGTHRPVEIHPELLVDVLLLRLLPTEILLVLSIAKHHVVFEDVPVYGTSSCKLQLLVQSGPQQFSAVVLVQQVDYNCLSTAYNLVAVLEVGQIDGWVLCSHFGAVHVEPLVLCLVDVFSLFIGYQDVLQHQPDHLGSPPNGPVH